MSIHKPVLLKKVIEYLNLHPGHNVIDCTFGGGGHGQEILKHIGKDGKLLAIDADKNTRIPSNPAGRQENKNKNLIFVNDNFKNLKDIIKNNFNYPVHGILLDLGLSSDQLEKSGRGFSFQKNEPLDMRFDINQDLTAAFILNSYSLENLYDIFRNLGEYPYARRLSQNIFKQRKLKKFTTTFNLVDVILLVHKRKYYHKIHPATQVFQALRIAVNDELTNLVQFLPQAGQILNKGGRLVVISFHALEDRIVKNYFRSLARLRPCGPNDPITQLDYLPDLPSATRRQAGGGQAPIIKILTKKPVTPSEEEVKTNPRSRSAKMRVIEKISTQL